MSISIQTNVSSLIAQQNLSVNNEFANQTIQRLTSGFRINSSGDDAAGLAVANQYRSNVAELMQGVRNGNDGLSMLQIVDGGLNNIGKMLDRMKTLATEAASGTFTGDKATLQDEYKALLDEIDRQATNIGLDTGGQWADSISVYIGGGTLTSAVATVTVDLSAGVVDTTGLSLTGTDVSTDAEAAIGAVNDALKTLGTVQGKVGAGQNDLSYAIKLAQSQISSYSAAESRIRDSDMAAEAANLTKAQVLQQASLAAMAQANTAPQAVLALLRQ
jgi:flagellin